MDFNSKDYQSVKLKNFFKINGFFFFFNSAKLNLNQWIHTEQNLKKLKLNYSKALNGTTLKVFKNSIYANINSVVSSFVLFINSNFLSGLRSFAALTLPFRNSISKIKSCSLSSG